MELLRIKNLAIKFQIMAEVAANQPDVQQKNIAKKLDLSPQAVSDYIRELVSAGWLSSEGRSRYSVTKEGVGWMLRGVRELQSYSDTVLKTIAGVSVSAAIADCDISEGQGVGLKMKDGLLFATIDADTEARGIAASNARKGDDVGVSNIGGIVPLKIGKVTVIRIPGIQKGGTRRVDFRKLKNATKDERPVGAIGIEALVALRKSGLKPSYLYGVKDAVVEAARCGICPVVLCVDYDTMDLLQKLEDKGIDYELIDLGRE
jgi:putative transcriptional regulator